MLSDLGYNLQYPKAVNFRRQPVIDAKTADELPSLPLFAYSKLREDILGGVIPAGTLLRQEKLAEGLGISRLPLREALTRLESEGLVVFRARRGYAVATLDPDEVAEIFDIRMIIEERAGFYAAQRRTRDDIRNVEAALSEMEQLEISSAEDARRFAIANRVFHEGLFSSSGRRHLCGMLINLRDKVEPFVRLGALMTGHLEHVRNDHRAIFMAFSRGDAPRTGTLCREHVRRAGERLVSNLRHEGAASASVDMKGGRRKPRHDYGRP